MDDDLKALSLFLWGILWIATTIGLLGYAMSINSLAWGVGAIVAGLHAAYFLKQAINY